MKKISKTRGRPFALCLQNKGYPASLEVGKLYRVVPDQDAAAHGYLRIVDESGEDYLYSAKRFVPVELPQQVKRSVIRRVRESTTPANQPLQPTRRAQRKSKSQRNSRAARG